MAYPYPYRNEKVEQCVLNFYKTLPERFCRFPLDIKEIIASFKKCRILSYQEVAAYNEMSIDAVIAHSKSKDGCTHKAGKQYIIMYNDAPYITQERKSFTIAHELGHILLGHLAALENSDIYLCSQNRKRAADYFAACLLCPQPLLTRIKPKSIAIVNKLFGLSYQASANVFYDSMKYDKYINIEWHDSILDFFECKFNSPDLLTYRLNYLCEASEEIEPDISIPPSSYNTWKAEPTPKITASIRSHWGEEDTRESEAESDMTPEDFERLEHDWLYPKSMGLS